MHDASLCMDGVEINSEEKKTEIDPMWRGKETCPEV